MNPFERVTAAFGGHVVDRVPFAVWRHFYPDENEGAAKLALNMISTATMVRLGKTKGDLMIDMRPVSAKLRERAIRIVRDESGLDEEEARRRLEASGWDVRAVLEASERR